MTTHMNVEVCALYDCCVNKKHVEHCGLRDEFPCETFLSYKDPSLSQEEGEQATLARKNDFLRRKQVGTEQRLEEQEGRGI